MLSSVHRVFVLGLGVSGLAVARFFQKRKIPVVVWDDCSIKRQEALNQELVVAPCPRWEEGFWYLTISPGIMDDRLSELQDACAQGKAMMTCDLGLFLICFPEARVLGVTGTNGKSTTCSLMSHILRERNISHQLAGNIGFPIFQVAEFHTPETWYILEWSSYQLHLCGHHAWSIQAGGVLNLTPHHLERHRTMEHYGSIKAQLLAHSTYAVIDRSGAHMHYVTMPNAEHPSVTYIGPNEQPDQDHNIRYDEVGIHEKSVTLTLSWLARWSAPAFRQNCTMAYALLRYVPGALTHMLEDITTFTPLEHRQEVCLAAPRVQCINDSKATTPEAALQALKAYAHPILWIAGGVLQDDELSVLKEGLEHIAEAFLYGEAAERFSEFLRAHKITCSTYPTLACATQAAWEKRLAYDTCTILCSPACPSFDAFHDFTERGRAFKTYVETLTHTADGAV